MRKNWGSLVVKLLIKTSKSTNFTTAYINSNLVYVDNYRIYTQTKPGFFHLKFTNLLPVKDLLLLIFHKPNNKLLFKLISY